MTTIEEINTNKKTARIAGLLYLIVAIFAAFAFVLARVYTPGDAATTAASVLANSSLVRIGVVADLIQATVFAFLGMALYHLLKHVNKNAARSMMVLIVGGVCYLVDMLLKFLVPDFSENVSAFLTIPPTFAEVWMVGYLLVKGVKVPAQDSPAVRAGKTSRVLGEGFS